MTTNPLPLSINTATLRKALGVDVPLNRIIDACASHGITCVAPWRDQVANFGLAKTAACLRANGMQLSGYCRGGMFTAATPQGLADAALDNKRAVDEACALGAPCLVLVVGGLPGALSGQAAHKNIAAARAQVFDGIAALLEYAKTQGMPLAIEPLHPMYAADRACVNTMSQALDVCDALDPEQTGALGVALDVYHCWWDPLLAQQIARAGRKRLLAFHVCDWLTPTQDMLNDRGMMGDGIIDLPSIRGLVQAQGYAGHSEVEIFSSNNWWQRSIDDTLLACIERHQIAC